MQLSKRRLEHLLLDSKTKLSRVEALERRAKFLYDRYGYEKMRSGKKLSFDLVEAKSILWVIEYINRTQELIKTILAIQNGEEVILEEDTMPEEDSSDAQEATV